MDIRRGKTSKAYVRDWYVAEFPDDDIAHEQLHSSMTFSEVIGALRHGGAMEAAELLFECDTQVRDRVIGEARTRMEAKRRTRRSI